MSLFPFHPINESAYEQAATPYYARFAKVLRHIHAHLQQDLSLDQLSEIAACSSFHFHRQFAYLFGMNVHRYVYLCRLKRAAYQLAFRAQQSVLDIALDNGYQSAEAFARAFKQCCGKSPSAFRKNPVWPAHLVELPLSPPTNLPTMPSTSRELNHAVQIRETDAIRVAVLTHRGDPRLLGHTIQQFIQWRKRHRLSPNVSATFNLLYEHPDDIAPDLFHLDLCVAIPAAFPLNDPAMSENKIPAGRCAVLRHVGSERQLEQHIRFLYAEWLPASGEQLRNFPLYLQRISFYPDVSEQAAITDIFLPLV